MATGEQLIRQLRQTIVSLRNKVPAEVGKSMFAETKDNFAKQQYGNDGAADRWRDRMGFIRGKGLVNAEPYLRYRKLNHTGKLLHGISWKSGKGFAEVNSAAPYSKDHNEGAKVASGGNSMRRPPSSSVPIKLGRTPHKRRFMGVGKRTCQNAVKLYEKEIKKLT